MRVQANGANSMLTKMKLAAIMLVSLYFFLQQERGFLLIGFVLSLKQADEHRNSKRCLEQVRIVISILLLLPLLSRYVLLN